ncbi:MAG TPA: hypothetical protein VKU19_24910 [Bryobacteraceae bacterium]|nr:hypothetical protein [Bryobacteraceae bacterium]
MWTRAAGFATVLMVVPALYAAVPQPADWVPIRWPWADVQSLDLLDGSPVNCLLLKTYPPDLVSAAAAKGAVTLALLTPASDPIAAAQRALAAKVTGIVLEGDFADDVVAAVRTASGTAPVIELTARNRIPLGSNAPVLGTYQGVWPGISALDDGGKKAGPTGSVWIDTNTGFIRAVRAWGVTPLWIANQPPSKTVVTGARYLQAIADAAISNGRWVLSFDSDFAARLHSRQADAVSDWKRIGTLIRYFEQHPEWRRMQEYGKLAVVQDPAKGGLLSGGILDMIAVKHTPVRPIPKQHLTAESLAGAKMAVNVDAESLSAEQKEILRAFARGGGTLLTGPPGWNAPTGNQTITLEKAELERLNDMWRDINSMVGRQNLGVRLFNVASMLSNLLISDDGKTAVLHLLNYSDYAVDNVAVHFIGDYKHAVVISPDGAEKPLEVYATEDGGGVDVDKVSVCATIRLW